MRKVLALVFVLLMATTSWAADAKISGLTALTAASGDDILPIVDDPGGSPATKKITVTNFLTSPAITTAIVPASADGAALGSATAEWSDLYLATGGIIYGENDQSNNLTSSSTQWTTSLDLTVGGGDLSIAAAGVKLTGSNGSLTILGLGDGQDEDVKIDLNTTADTIEITSPASSATAVDLNTLNLLMTGYISSAINVITDADNHTVSATEAYGGFGVSTGAGTWTLPAVAAGMSFCVIATGAHDVTVDVDASDAIILNGTAESNGEAIDSGDTAGEFVCLLGISSTQWIVVGKSGTWTGE